MADLQRENENPPGGGAPRARPSAMIWQRTKHPGVYVRHREGWPPLGKRRRALPL